MKLSLRLIALVCLLTLCLSCFSSALAAANDYAYVKSSKTKVYKTAGMSSRQSYITKYEVVIVLETNDRLARVSYNGKIGYMYLKDLCAVDPLDRSAALTRSAYVYAKPSTSAAKKSVSKGTRVNVLAVNGSWAMVEKGSAVGYIQLPCLSEYSEDTIPAPTQNASTYSLSGEVFTCDLEAVVNCSALSVYKSASTSSSKLCTVKKGTTVQVWAYNDTWAYVESNGSFGYCKLKYLKKVVTATPSPALTEDGFPKCAAMPAAVTAAKLKVYEAPFASSSYLGYVGKGGQVTVLGYDKTWALISLNGRTGYALKSGLKPMPSAASTPSPTSAPTPSPTPAPSYAPSEDPIFADTSASNAEKIYRYFTYETPYNEAVACGILASISQESGCSPTSGKGKSYQGLCQWSSSRFSILQNWCNSQGLDPYSLEGQCKFLYYDLSQRYTLYNKNLLAFENSSQGAYDAGYYFCYYYERPAGLESSSDKRGRLARDTYWPKYAH